VLGAPGSGKTLLGLSFLDAGARASVPEPGLYFGFFDAPANLCRKAEGIGVGLAAHLESGLVGIMCLSPLDAIADALAEKVLATVRERGVRRLFIDGLLGFQDSLVYPERAGRFFAALCNELRALGVTTVLSDELPIRTPVHGLLAMLDNVISFRHVELRARCHRLVSVTKVREGASDSSLRELSIDAAGIHVSATPESAEAILSGIARIRPAPRRASSGPTKTNAKKRRR